MQWNARFFFVFVSPQAPFRLLYIVLFLRLVLKDKWTMVHCNMEQESGFKNFGHGMESLAGDGIVTTRSVCLSVCLWYGKIDRLTCMGGGLRASLRHRHLSVVERRYQRLMMRRQIATQTCAKTMYKNSYYLEIASRPCATLNK